MTPNFTVMATSTPGSISVEGINNEKRGEKLRSVQQPRRQLYFFLKATVTRVDICHCIHKCRYKNPLITKLFCPVMRTHARTHTHANTCKAEIILLGLIVNICNLFILACLLLFCLFYAQLLCWGIADVWLIYSYRFGCYNHDGKMAPSCFSLFSVICIM